MFIILLYFSFSFWIKQEQPHQNNRPWKYFKNLCRFCSFITRKSSSRKLKQAYWLMFPKVRNCSRIGLRWITGGSVGALRNFDLTCGSLRFAYYMVGASRHLSELGQWGNKFPPLNKWVPSFSHAFFSRKYATILLGPNNLPTLHFDSKQPFEGSLNQLNLTKLCWDSLIGDNFDVPNRVRYQLVSGL